MRNRELRVKAGCSIRKVGGHLYTNNCMVNEEPNHARSLALTGPNNMKDKLVKKSDRRFRDVLMFFKIRWRLYSR